MRDRCVCVEPPAWPLLSLLPSAMLLSPHPCLASPHPTTSSCTHPWPFPNEGDLGPLAVEERGVVGWEVCILEEDALLHTRLPQLLKALAGGVGDVGVLGNWVLLGPWGPIEVRHGCSLAGGQVFPCWWETR